MRMSRANAHALCLSQHCTPPGLLSESQMGWLELAGFPLWALIVAIKKGVENKREHIIEYYNTDNNTWNNLEWSKPARAGEPKGIQEGFPAKEGKFVFSVFIKQCCFHHMVTFFKQRELTPNWKPLGQRPGQILELNIERENKGLQNGLC